MDGAQQLYRALSRNYPANCLTLEAGGGGGSCADPAAAPTTTAHNNGETHANVEGGPCDYIWLCCKFAVIACQPAAFQNKYLEGVRVERVSESGYKVRR